MLSMGRALNVDPSLLSKIGQDCIGQFHISLGLVWGTRHIKLYYNTFEILTLRKNLNFSLLHMKQDCYDSKNIILLIALLCIKSNLSLFQLIRFLLVLKVYKL